MVKLIALYKKPDNVSAFDKHYAEVHTPLVKKLPGLRQLELSKITARRSAKRPNTYYAKCILTRKMLSMRRLHHPQAGLPEKTSWVSLQST